MGHVAGQAIFVHRWMLEHKGTPLRCMALVAEFIHRISFDHLATETTVRIMTVKTRHLPFPYGVMGLFQGLRSNILVTAIT
jgi:hypothetical protein